MARRKSWAEGHWWRGAIRSYVWIVALILLFPFLLQPLLLRQRAAQPLQRYYIQAYRTSCSVVPRPLVLPYVHRANGSTSLASISDVVVLPPSGPGRLRVALTDAALRTGATRVEFVRTTEARLPTACAGLDRQIQLNAQV